MSDIESKGRAKKVAVNEWLSWLESGARIPKLEPLSSAIPGGKTFTAEDLDPDIRKTAEDWADLFRRLAEAYNFSLLGVEMAVIADRRRQHPSVPSYFASYVTFFAAHPAPFHAAYRDCINRALSPDSPPELAYREPIVVHPHLYELTTGYFHSSIGCEPRAKSDRNYEGVLQASGYPLTQENDQSKPNRGVLDQVNDVAQLLANVDDPEVRSELRAASLVVLPFVRPKYEPPRQIRTRLATDATPGGCIFFVLRDSVAADDPRLGEFLAKARWALAEASAGESHTAFEAVARQREFSAAMLHGTSSAIAAIGTSNIISHLIHGEGDHRNLSVDDLIVNFTGPSESVAHKKRLLVNSLQHALNAELLASSLSGFAEIFAEEGRLREKFLSKEDTSLLHLIDLSWNLAKASVDKPTHLNLGREQGSLSDWTLPSGYISSDLLIAVLMELFRNAIAHGAPAHSEHRIKVSTFDRKGSVIVQIENTCEEAQVRAHPVSGFLSRISMLWKHIGGLDLHHNDGRDGVYVASLRLGEISTSRTNHNDRGPPIIVQVRPLPPRKRT